MKSIKKEMRLAKLVSSINEWNYWLIVSYHNGMGWYSIYLMDTNKTRDYKETAFISSDEDNCISFLRWLVIGIDLAVNTTNEDA